MAGPSVGSMRLLQTSDWHVGRTFHGRDLLSDQRVVLRAVADLVAEHRVDVVLVAGDLYDRAVPSPAAIGVLAEAFAAIREAGAVIVASSGNHDSAPRLGAFAEFLAAGGLHLRTDPAGVGDPVLLQDEHGPVALHPLPFLDPEVARVVFGLTGPVRHQHVVGAAMQRVRDDLAGRPGTRSVVLAHAFVVGAVAAGSERSIAVGGVESVTADVFDGIDHVALGHLHGRQQVTPRLHYSGSPLAFSFGEARHRKGVLLVDLAADGATTVTPLELPVPRPLAEISGPIDELLAGHDALVEHYLSVTLTDPVRPLDAMRRLQERFPHAVTLTWQPPSDGRTEHQPALRDGASDRELVDEFLLVCRGSAASPRESELLDRALLQAAAGRDG